MTHQSRGAARLRRLALPFLLTFPAGAAFAQVPISGSVYDGNGGPLLSGVVYHATSHVIVPGGQTLSIQPGAIVKFMGGFYVDCYGTLNADGSPTRPIIFTSGQDDTAGGDTNGNGPSTGLPGQWAGLYFEGSSDGSVLDHAEVRFAGTSSYAGVSLVDSNATLTDSSISSCANDALDLFGTSSSPLVHQCTFDNNGGRAVDRARVDAVPGFTNNSATGNAGGNYIFVSAPSPSADLTITAESCLNGALVFGSHCIVGATLTMTLAEGVVIKPSGGFYFDVYGTLNALGTPADPVVFTSFADDTVAGDTNGNGASVGSPGDWAALYFRGSSDASVLDHAEVRFAGSGSYAGVELSDADITLTDCSISSCANDALDLFSTSSSPLVHQCTFDNNGGRAVDRARVDAVPGFTNNLASGNGGNYIFVSQPSPTMDLTITAPSCLNGALVFGTHCIVGGALTLTLAEGVVIKPSGGFYFDVFGTLSVLGTQANPVVVTSFADDSIAGDTNGNGASVGSPGDWAALYFRGSSDASVLDHAEVRFAGSGSYAGVELSDADVTLTNCRISDCANDGLDLLGSSSRPTVNQCSFVDNASRAVDRARLDAVPGFSNNSAVNNGGDYIFVSTPSPSMDLTIVKESCLNGALVMGTHCTLAGGRTLTLGEGVVIKPSGGFYFDVYGTLNMLGTSTDPVVVTSFADDSVAGDTNGDGPSSGSPGAWAGLYIENGGLGTVQNVRLRYAGASSYSAFRCSGQVAASLIRAEHCAARGFDVSNLAGTGESWIAWMCGGVGIDLTGGAFNLDHITVCANTGGGIKRANPYSGVVQNAIAWNNTPGGNFIAFSAGQLLFSDGSSTLAGGNGNIEADPLFKDESQGDLRLQDDSPCIDTGNPASPPDPDSSQTDMGAYLFDRCRPVVYCTGKMNSQGCVPAISFDGYASASNATGFGISVGQLINNKTGLFFFGKTGAVNLPFQGGTLCVDTPILRTPALDTGGNPGPDDCSGSLSFEFNSWIQAGGTAGLIKGLTVYGQFWYRDPLSPSQTGLSDALKFRICD